LGVVKRCWQSQHTYVNFGSMGEPAMASGLVAQAAHRKCVFSLLEHLRPIAQHRLGRQEMVLALDAVEFDVPAMQDALAALTLLFVFDLLDALHADRGVGRFRQDVAFAHLGVEVDPALGAGVFVARIFSGDDFSAARAVHVVDVMGLERECFSYVRLKRARSQRTPTGSFPAHHLVVGFVVVGVTQHVLRVARVDHLDLVDVSRQVFFVGQVAVADHTDDFLDVVLHPVVVLPRLNVVRDLFDSRALRPQHDRVLRL
jgi:hypothetical protein